VAADDPPEQSWSGEPVESLLLAVARAGGEDEAEAGRLAGRGVAVGDALEQRVGCPDADEARRRDGVAAADHPGCVRRPDSTVLASLRDGQLLGTAMVGHDGHRGWVYYLAVREGRRRCGTGRRLMEACEQWTAARGVPKLQLMVRAGNEPVLEFSERLGYQVDEVVVLGPRLG
jgi:ribosomal protein S18 acetylase RimI-like enzyme